VHPVAATSIVSDRGLLGKPIMVKTEKILVKLQYLRAAGL
jgi:hypothetical protein